MVFNPYENWPRADILEAQMLRLPQVLWLFGKHHRSLHIRDILRPNLHNQKQVQPLILSRQSTYCTLLLRWMPPVSSPTQTWSSHRMRPPCSHHFQYICWNSPQQHTYSRGSHCYIPETEAICKRRNTLITPKGWGTSHGLQTKPHKTNIVHNRPH